MTTCDTPVHDPDLVLRLREDLTDIGFRVDAVDALLGAQAVDALGREQPFAARQRLAELAGDPLAAVVGLFSVGMRTSTESIGRALTRTGVEGLVRLGLVTPVEGDAVRARCDLRPYGDEQHTWWVASDLGGMVTGGPLRSDHVLGIGGASLTLASWTPRAKVARAADIGTGCGVQALHLSAHADEVVVTDVSERALAYARFNAALAGLSWDVRRGSLWEPLAGESFDLVVSNPPFVITPRGADVPVFDYRDGGAAGDAIVARMVRGAAEHLAPGGVAHLLGNWETRPGQDWREVWQGWLAGTGLDAFVVQRDVQDPVEYAELWARDAGLRPGSPEHDAWLGAWLEDFGQRGVGRIGFGVITLRRPVTGRPGRVDLVEHAGPVAAPMGPAVLARLAAREWLEQHSREEALARVWRMAPDVTEERYGRPGASDPSVILLRQGGGLGVSVRADTVLAGLVGVCDGDLTAGQALGGIAALLDLPVDEVIDRTWPGVEQLILDGLLLPV
ncbi:Methyltransferase small domain-containing protein [Austwickia chelonae]|uniref:Putative methyltransferase n=1 Tax=Austwickia chelonae NBRC 105200 TaxID=1184607 RepID=K6V4H1_9MICO|nr:class I SAM-dependent methyltransferase [Austwickia chelonae]GAB77013.1 putative methyltransferase [Austwickia chelonae NBRC 105200]SEW33280.1 Methyltransferase small domain-containing protein [Austwickia chelonae]